MSNVFPRILDSYRRRFPPLLRVVLDERDPSRSLRSRLGREMLTNEVSRGGKGETACSKGNARQTGHIWKVVDAKWVIFEGNVRYT